jgi:hypothetical protein
LRSFSMPELTVKGFIGHFSVSFAASWATL